MQSSPSTCPELPPRTSVGHDPRGSGLLCTTDLNVHPGPPHVSGSLEMMLAFPCRALLTHLGCGSLWYRTHNLIEGMSECPISIWTRLNIGEVGRNTSSGKNSAKSGFTLSARQVSDLRSPKNLWVTLRRSFPLFSLCSVTCRVCGWGEHCSQPPVSCALIKSSPLECGAPRTCQ